MFYLPQDSADFPLLTCYQPNFANNQASQRNAGKFKPVDAPPKKSPNRFVDLAFSSLLVILIFQKIPWVFRTYDSNWDLLNYHLTNASKVRDNFLHPSGIQSFLNPLLDRILFPIHTELPVIWNVLVLSLIFPTIVVIIRKLYLPLFLPKNKYPWTVSIATCSSSLALSEFGNTMGDLLLTAPILIGVYLFLDGVSERKQKKILSSGFILGAVIGLKISFGYLTIGIFFALAYNTIKVRSIIGISQFLVGSGAGFLITYASHGVNLYKDFNNPVFPFFNKFFQSEFYPNTNFKDDRFGLNSIESWINFVVNYARGVNAGISEIPLRDIRYLIIVMLFALAFGLKISSQKNHIDFLRKRISNLRKPLRETIHVNHLLSVFLVFTLLSWGALFGIGRYLIPFDIVLGMATFMVASQIFGKRQHAYPILLSLILVTTASTGNWGRSPIVTWHTPSFEVESIETSFADRNAFIFIDQPLSFMAILIKNQENSIWLSPAFNEHDLENQNAIIGSLPIVTVKFTSDPVTDPEFFRKYKILRLIKCEGVRSGIQSNFVPNVVELCQYERLSEN
jgi:hypothetical protein